jgi:hypothetical protein
MLSSIHFKQHELREPRGEQGESQQAIADPRQHGIVASPANTRIAAILVLFCGLSFYVCFHASAELGMHVAVLDP